MPLEAQYFDGRSARAQPVRLRIEGDLLLVEGDRELARWPVAAVQWPERTRHGQRVLHFPDGASASVADSAAYDGWRRDTGAREGVVVRAQQSWRLTLVAIALLLLTAFVFYQWGTPLAARAILAFVPDSVDVAVGDATLDSMDRYLLQPSKLPAARQRALRQSLSEAVADAWPGGGAPVWQLHFRSAEKTLGANAFALPGGHIVVTDQLAELLAGADDTLIGVLGHELGHVRRRDGMQGVVRFALIGAVTSVALGDFSTVLAGAPALLAHLSYARDAERAADAEAARVLRASRRSPAVMVLLFDRLEKKKQASQGGGLGIAFADHPADDERRAYFRDPMAGRSPGD